MNKIKFTVLAIVAAFATTAAASDIEFHGYTRAGVALNQAGGTGTCYHLRGADTDYRLGNECDYVIEPNFEITMAKLDDKSSWGFHFMPKVYKRWQNMGGRDLDPLAMWVGQVYFFGNNIPWLANGSLWAGRKYWARLQLGINDQFIENEDSDGVGIENMDLGFGKLSIGFGMNSGSHSSADYDYTNNVDTVGNAFGRRYKIAAQLTGIQTFNKDSSLQIWGAIYRDWNDEDFKPEDSDMGYRIGVYHNLGLGTAGNVFVGFKYGAGDDISNADGAAGLGRLPPGADDDVEPGKLNKAWRVFAQYGVAVPSIRTSFDVLAEYRSKEFEYAQGPTGNQFDKQTWWTVGARADAQLSGPFRALLEVGYDNVDKSPVTGESENLLKITPVLAISAGNDPWSRPTFRFYYTYAKWSEVNVLDDWSSPGSQALAGADKKSGGSFGVQAEGWW